MTFKGLVIRQVKGKPASFLLILNFNLFKILPEQKICVRPLCCYDPVSILDDDKADLKKLSQMKGIQYFVVINRVEERGF